MVVLEGIEPSLGTNQVRTVYKAVGASSYTTRPKDSVESHALRGRTCLYRSVTQRVSFDVRIILCSTGITTSENSSSTYHVPEL